MGYPYINKEYQQTRYNVTKCQNRRVAGSVKYIVIHYTGTDASAKNNCIYFSGGNRNASADYFIEKDGTIYKFNANCAKYYSWHCGDGKGKYGITNSNSISIEICSRFNRCDFDTLIWILTNRRTSSTRSMNHISISI